MILVVGGTGTVGRLVVADLLERGHRVRLLTRDHTRVPAWVTERAEVVVADLSDRAALEVALDEVDRAYLASSSGPEQVDLETGFIDAAARRGLRRLVKLSGGLAAHPDRNLFGRFHAEVEAHLKAAPLAWTLLRPNWFMENFFGVAETIAAQGVIYGAAGQGRIAFVDARDTAAVAVAALVEEGHEGQTYRVTGPEALTFAEAAGRIGVGLARQVDYVDMPEDAYRQALEGAGLPQDLVGVLLAGFRSARENLFDDVSDEVERLTGRPARPLDTFARDHAPAFTPRGGAAA